MKRMALIIGLSLIITCDDKPKVKPMPPMVRSLAARTACHQINSRKVILIGTDIYSARPFITCVPANRHSKART